VEPGPVPWDICSQILNYVDDTDGDMIPLYEQLVIEYDVLIYSGDADTCVNYIGTQLAAMVIIWRYLVLLGERRTHFFSFPLIFILSFNWWKNPFVAANQNSRFDGRMGSLDGEQSSGRLQTSSWR
jgi:hypothetical protein